MVIPRESIMYDSYCFRVIMISRLSVINKAEDKVLILMRLLINDDGICSPEDATTARLILAVPFWFNTMKILTSCFSGGKLRVDGYVSKESLISAASSCSTFFVVVIVQIRNRI